MLKQISKLSVHQTSKIMAGIYTFFMFIIGILVLPFVIYASSQEDHLILGILFIYIFAFILYFIFNYIVIAISCFIYNIVAKRLGGIEFELIDRSE